MAKVRQLEAGVSVAPQLTETDFAELAARGFRSVVNNRPEGEAPDQLANAEAEAAARAAGLAFRFHPVTHMHVTDDANVAAFAAAVQELPQPILFYCRSGTRCATLWAQASVARLGLARTLRIAAESGYDLEVLRDELEARAAKTGT